MLIVSRQISANVVRSLCRERAWRALDEEISRAHAPPPGPPKTTPSSVCCTRPDQKWVPINGIQPCSTPPGCKEAKGSTAYRANYFPNDRPLNRPLRNPSRTQHQQHSLHAHPVPVLSGNYQPLIPFPLTPLLRCMSRTTWSRSTGYKAWRLFIHPGPC